MNNLAMTQAQPKAVSTFNRGAFAAWYSAGTNAVRFALAMQKAKADPYSHVKVTGTDLVVSYKGGKREAWQKLHKAFMGNASSKVAEVSREAEYFKLVAACGFVFYSVEWNEDGKGLYKGACITTVKVLGNLRFAEALQVEVVKAQKGKE